MQIRKYITGNVLFGVILLLFIGIVIINGAFEIMTIKNSYASPIPLEQKQTDCTTVGEKEHIKIFVVSSYNPHHICSRPQMNGLQAALGTMSGKYNFQLEGTYMYIRTENTTERKQRRITKKILQAIDKFKPDYIITIDDAAFHWVGVPSIKKGIPVYFTGMNVNPKKYMEEFDLAETEIHGVLERNNVRIINRVLDNARIIPDAIHILVDSSATSHSMTKEYVEGFGGMNNPRIKIHKILNTAQLFKLLKNLNKKSQGLLILTLQSIVDDCGCPVVKPEIVRFITVHNKKHIVVCSNNAFSKLGADVSIGPDFYQMGKKVGQLILEALMNPNFNNMRRVVVSEIGIATNTEALKAHKALEIYTENEQMIGANYDRVNK